MRSILARELHASLQLFPNYKLLEKEVHFYKLKFAISQVHTRGLFDNHTQFIYNVKSFFSYKQLL